MPLSKIHYKRNFLNKQINEFKANETKYADYDKLKSQLDAIEREKMTEQERLAKEIYSINRNIIIDTDLTENFRNSYLHEKDFKLDIFDPNIKLKRIFERDSVTPLGILKQMKERYSNPIWGISRDLLEVIDDRIKETEEEYKKMNLYKKR